MRPQGTAFADSARARDSVMSLGSIAALQYYFARTGLLDGKGAQMAKDRKTSSTTAGAVSEQSLGEEDGENIWESMAPPAVSTYRHKDPITEPLPDMRILRRQLREALGKAKTAVEKCTQEDVCAITITPDGESSNGETCPPSMQGWHEVQGLNILDLVTLAIRQARMYYVTHAHPQNLYALRSEREIRSDLYQVLDILKRMASRDFRGGVRVDEQSGIVAWIGGIQDLLSREEQQEAEELGRRNQWPWRDGDWSGREREREWHFLRSFDVDSSPLPDWEFATSPQPSAFLLALSAGLRLIGLHNEMVKRSKRPFGEITTFYTDLAKPYRRAENLRYWAKAAELRWEIKLNFNALDVVHGESEVAWQRFDQAILAWCRRVRQELSQDWAHVESDSSTVPHTLCGASDEKVVMAF